MDAILWFLQEFSALFALAGVIMLIPAFAKSEGTKRERMIFSGLFFVAVLFVALAFFFGRTHWLIGVIVIVGGFFAHYDLTHQQRNRRPYLGERIE